MALFPEIVEKIIQLENSFDGIQQERKELLGELAKYIRRIKGEVRLTFICTHNSRRSHIAQIWAQTAAEYYGIKNVKCYSGGTEATAFNPRAVKALRDTGFLIEQGTDDSNPIYTVIFGEDVEGIIAFSKKYDDAINPNRNFAAVMTCSHADENCPVVFGAEARFPVKYDDPKEYDNTPLEENKYAERVTEIGREMLYTMSCVKR